MFRLNIFSYIEIYFIHKLQLKYEQYYILHKDTISSQRLLLALIFSYLHIVDIEFAGVCGIAAIFLMYRYYI